MSLTNMYSILNASNSYSDDSSSDSDDEYLSLLKQNLIQSNKKINSIIHSIKSPIIPPIKKTFNTPISYKSILIKKQQTIEDVKENPMKSVNTLTPCASPQTIYRTLHNSSTYSNYCPKPIDISEFDDCSSVSSCGWGDYSSDSDLE
jgi:hypothetical protein